MAMEKKKRTDEDWRHVLPVGALVLTVAGTMLLGAVLTRAGRPSDAVAVYREAVAADPTHPEALAGLGLLLAELGDLSRFESPRQLMAYLGLVPSEHSSGAQRRQGGITLTGNRHARRMLVESAWSYRFPARQTAHLKRKAASASDEARAIAWKAQKRLCGRYRTLSQAGKNTKLVCVAVARELVGFIWDIACREMPKVHQQATR